MSASLCETTHGMAAATDRYVLCISTLSDSKIELTMLVTSPVKEFVRAVATQYGYEPDSIELVLQRSANGEQVVLTEDNDETLEEAGLEADHDGRNSFLLKELSNSRLRHVKGGGDEEELSLGASASPTATPALPEPRHHHHIMRHLTTGYVGLVNQAMTCYLNSLLQALYMTPEFRNALYKWRCDEACHPGPPPHKSIPFELQKLFLNLQTSCRNAIETTELTRSFGWDSSEAWQQHDIQELCRVMFDALEQEFKGTDQADLINNLYQGKMIDYVKCLECKREKTREDTFLDIPLPIRPFGGNVAYGSVEEALRGFVQPETLDGNNQYACESCAKSCDAHKGLKFSSFPYLLTLHLKRFDFDYTTMHRIKLNDKVAFPEILNLNQFVCGVDKADGAGCTAGGKGDTTAKVEEGSEGLPEELVQHNGKSAQDDGSTTGSGSALDDESCNEATTQMEPDQDEDEGIDVTCEQPSERNSRNGDGKGTKATSGGGGDRGVAGPYLYQLFAIMIHSGSASGGHYYAYIKDLHSGDWFCFNDQTVSPITQDDITKTYGGGPMRGLMFSGAYTSSTNAYMLMYRQIDKQRNTPALTADQFPQHIKELHARLLEREEHDRIMKEREQNMCKMKLYAYKPDESNTLVESKLYCHMDVTLQEATQLAYQNLGMNGIVPLEQCRLVSYNNTHDMVEVSFEGRQDEAMGFILADINSNNMLLETKPQGELFRTYRPGSIVIKVHLVEMNSGDIEEPILVHANLSMKVSELKQEVAAAIPGLDSTNMTLVLYKCSASPTSASPYLLAVNEATLRQDAFTLTNKVFVCSGGFDFDPDKSFVSSRLNKLICRFQFLITLHVTLPATDPETLERLSIPVLRTEIESSGVGPNMEDGNGATSSNTASDQSTSEDSSLTDSERTLIGNECQLSSPSDSEQQSSSFPASSRCSRLYKTLIGNECQLSSPGDLEQQSSPFPSHQPLFPPIQDSEPENWDDDEEKESAAATTLPCSINTSFYFKAVPYVAHDKNMLRVVVDKRMEVRHLKMCLEPYVGVPLNYFKIFRWHTNLQEMEFSRHTLNDFREDEHVSIKLGRALRPGETRGTIFHLVLENPLQTSPMLCEGYIAKGSTVGETKAAVLDEINRKHSMKIPFDRCRLRKKSYKYPSKVHLDKEIWEVDISVANNWELFLQELPGPEPVVNTESQTAVFARRWNPSSLTLGPFQEVVLDTNLVHDLKQKLSDVSGIPVDCVQLVKAPLAYPSDVSVLSIHSNHDWNCQAEFIDSAGLKINDDGAVVFYRDSREELKVLTTEEQRELAGRESARLIGSVPMHIPSASYCSPRKERGLKIYLDPAQRRPPRAVILDSDVD